MDAKILETDRLSINREPEEHDFVLGIWKKKETGKYKYEAKADICSKCKCERHMVRNENTDKEGIVSLYWRGNQFFNDDHMPLCWGSPNP